jgi:hypothetical protein
VTLGATPDAVHTARRLEAATIGWNTIEAAVAVVSGVVAGSVALTGFGLDSGIEVVSAVLVLNRLRTASHGEASEARERRTLRAIAVTFFALAVYLTADGIELPPCARTPDDNCGWGRMGLWEKVVVVRSGIPRSLSGMRWRWWCLLGGRRRWWLGSWVCRIRRWGRGCELGGVVGWVGVFLSGRRSWCCDVVFVNLNKRLRF